MSTQTTVRLGDGKTIIRTHDAERTLCLHQSNVAREPGSTHRRCVTDDTTDKVPYLVLTFDDEGALDAMIHMLTKMRG